MTSKMIEVFPHRGGEFEIEPDASSGSYFLAIRDSPEFLEYSSQFGMEVTTKLLNPIKVYHWPKSGWQVDQYFPELMQPGYSTKEFQKELQDLLNEKTPEAVERLDDLMRRRHDPNNPCVISRLTDLGDSIMTAIVMAPLQDLIIRFTDLGRLRVQECERVVALRTELTKCGAQVIEEGDTLTVHPSKLHGAEIETYNDHRMAMCFAILGLKIPGIKIKNPVCVKKTFPNFFQKLAAAPPKGLGAIIRDAATGRQLTHDELFAD